MNARLQAQTAPADGHSGEGAVLVLNSGSSSLKFALVDPATGRRPLSGVAERLGTAAAQLRLVHADEPPSDVPLTMHGHQEAVGVVLDAIRNLPSSQQPTSAGHRVVHGGERYSDSVVVTEGVMDAIADLAALAPLHNPPALEAIRAVGALWPDLPQVAVFDTAFHQSMPPRAFRYAVAEEWLTRNGVRRYGFHGTSYRYVSQRAAQMLGRPVEDLALVVAHLGNGCSAAAIQDGQSVDTTMGLTPMEGLVMGTRSGDIDPGVFSLLEHVEGWSTTRTADALNRESGLLGLSGRSHDMRELRHAAATGDDRAALAIDVFCYRLAKAVAALRVPLRRLDALVFTGGIGEHDAGVRRQVVAGLGHLGMTLDDKANEEGGSQTSGRISDPGSVHVMVVPTDEELMIARDARRLVGPTATP